MKSTFQPGLIFTAAPSPRPLIAGALSGYRPPLAVFSRYSCTRPSHQGASSECVARAIKEWIEFHRWQDLGIYDDDTISATEIYRKAKTLDAFPKADGTTLEAGLDAAEILGLLPPTMSGSVRSVDRWQDVKRALHQYGVMVASFHATDQWPLAGEDGWIKPFGRAIGGHAVLLCEYHEKPRDGRPYYGFLDSYGTEAGHDGFKRVDPDEFARTFAGGLIWDFESYAKNFAKNE